MAHLDTPCTPELNDLTKEFPSLFSCQSTKVKDSGHVIVTRVHQPNTMNSEIIVQILFKLEMIFFCSENIYIIRQYNYVS